jgi:hypothetical protein
VQRSITFTVFYLPPLSILRRAPTDVDICERGVRMSETRTRSCTATSPGVGADHRARYGTCDGSVDDRSMPATVHADTSDKRMRNESCSTVVPAV